MLIETKNGLIGAGWTLDNFNLYEEVCQIWSVKKDINDLQTPQLKKRRNALVEYYSF